MPGPGPNAPLRLPPKCNRCQLNRVAWTSPRVDVCYECLPGGPFAAPACVRCGSHQDYFSQGLCGRCHPRSPEHVGPCRGCLALGCVPALQLDLLVVQVVGSPLLPEARAHTAAV